MPTFRLSPVTPSDRPTFNLCKVYVIGSEDAQMQEEESQATLTSPLLLVIPLRSRSNIFLTALYVEGSDS